MSRIKRFLFLAKPQADITLAGGASHRLRVGVLLLWFAAASCAADEPMTDQYLSNTRQITFGGLRAGEGYFSADGAQMVFQSERDLANPFYQIYLTNLETGDIRQISPGYGKTTCAWIHPDGKHVLFAGTLDDPDARADQVAELELRARGEQKRYAWDYDPDYELYAVDLKTNARTRLTHARGYDAEASYSPSGDEIIFASNRAAFEHELSDRDRQQFEIDPAFMNDIYLMNADGSNVRRLTTEPGYDGGPFFSADGKRICWRRFSADGATAEIFVANRDGSEPQRVTNLGAMSWAPYYHPSGEYLVFTTNLNGFANFELYLVRADGSGDPLRVTYTDGFDGLPVFTPDGKHLSWTSTRNDKKQSQIYLSDWDHHAARTALGLETSATLDDVAIAGESAKQTGDDYATSDLIRHVDYLTRPDLGGRLTGTEGEKRATAYVAAYLDSLGFVPAGNDGTYFENFDFPAGSEILPATSISVLGQSLKQGTDFVPLSFSGDGVFEAGEVIFAGYGMQVPATEAADENEDGKEVDPITAMIGDGYDSYIHLNVQDRYVMVLRDMPQDITPEMRQRMARYSSPRRKATIARDMGAKGILFVAGPTSGVKNQLIRFDNDASGARVSMAAISITDEIAQQILGTANLSLGELQKSIDDGSMAMGTTIENANISANVAIERRTGTGRNVIARLPAGGDAAAAVQYPIVMIGAHIDHLGRGGGGNSLARDNEQQQIHFGADDNASGVASMLEMAQYIAAARRQGRIEMRRDLVVAAWSGEELGLFGSQAFIEHFMELFSDAPVQALDPDSEMARVAAAHGVSTDAAPLGAAIAAYFNLDMVGRMQDKLIIQGIGSSPGFDAEVQRRNVPVGLPLTLDRTATRLPTDASAFVARDVPILSAFTGAHEDYHTPRDTADKLNYDAMVKIARLSGLVVRGWLTDERTPVFRLDEGQNSNDEVPRARLTAYLGTIPDYVATDIKGLKLSGVAKGGPADSAGVRGGDVIVNLAGKTIEGIYDYTYAIEALKVGQEVEIVVQRGDATTPLRITPAARE